MKKWTLFFCCTLFMSSLLFAEEFESHIPVKRAYSTPFSMRIGVLGSGIINTGGIEVGDMAPPNLDNIMAHAQKIGGLNAHALVNADVYAQFTIKNAHTVKLNLTGDVEGRASITKELIALLKGDVSGIKLPNIDQSKLIEQLIASGGDPNNIDIMKIVDPKQLEAIFTALVDPAKNFVRANAFFDFGALYQFSGNSYRIAARVSPFIPLAYTPIPNSSGVKVRQSGNKLNVSMDQYWYTALSENNKADFSKMGLDFSLAGSYTLARWVDVGLTVKNIPILASKLDKGIKYDFSFDVDPRTKAVENKSKGSANITALPMRKVSRLCKIRIGTDFRPLLNDYLIVSPFAAFPLGHKGSFYVDSGVKFESHFARILGAYYALKWIDKNWQQEACLFIDSRWATALIGVSVFSDSFATMFTSPNVGIKAGLGFGL